MYVHSSYCIEGSLTMHILISKTISVGTTAIAIALFCSENILRFSHLLSFNRNSQQRIQCLLTIYIFPIKISQQCVVFMDKSNHMVPHHLCDITMFHIKF